jgi:hypothetical protein
MIETLVEAGAEPPDGSGSSDIKGRRRVAVELKAVRTSQNKDHVIATHNALEVHRNVGVRSVRVRLDDELLGERSALRAGEGIDDRGFELARLPLEADSNELHGESAARVADGNWISLTSPPIWVAGGCGGGSSVAKATTPAITAAITVATAAIQAAVS